MSHFDNDDALAYGFSMIILYFIVGIVIWFCWAYAFNVINGAAITPDILAGDISIQTAHATQWNMDMIRYAPPVILLLGFIFVVNRAVVKRGGA
jgi:hypothetical protein